VIDRGEHEERQFIVFEYVDGDNLKEVVNRSGAMDVERVLLLAIQISSGLAFAHANGLVHRDVKPQNVLLNGDGTAKVTDFGIARSLDVGKGVTQTGTVLGTSDYIAPEQAQGQSVGERTDIYSLGIVLYELLTGELPFAGDNFVAVAMKHINEPAPRVSSRRPDVPTRLDAAIATALAKDPDARFARMEDFRRELQAALAELRSGTAAPADPAAAVAEHEATVVLPAGMAAPRRRRSLVPLLLVVLGLGLLAGVGWVAYETFSADGDGGSGGAVAGGSSPVRLEAVSAWDPEGQDGEHDARVPEATDGDPATYWRTERYDAAPSFGIKEGVGLVLEASSSRDVDRITIVSDTPGYEAQIRAGSSATGPFQPVSEAQTVGSRTAFDLEDTDGRYFLIWITSLPAGGSAHVSEVTAS